MAEQDRAGCGGEEARAQAWQVALQSTAKTPGKLQCRSYMDWELWPILDLQIHFSPTQLLRDSEITLFAGSNARVVQAFSRVEGVWLLSCAPGSMQNISEATLPSKSGCRQEVHLPSLSKMQFGRRVPGGAGGHEVSALPRWQRPERVPEPANVASPRCPGQAEPAALRVNRGESSYGWLLMLLRNTVL